jgi:outer membrane protein
MKRVLSAGLFAVVALLAGASQGSAQTGKIGYVNSQRLLNESAIAQQAQRAFETDMTRYRTQIDSIGRAFEARRADYERQQATLSAAVKTQREQELQRQFEASQQQASQIEQTAQRRQQELLEPVMKRIRETIDAVRREGGYTAILDAAAVISADPSLDITQQVLTRLGGAAPATAAPAAPRPR